MPDSTRRLFDRIGEGQLGKDFPDELKTAFRSAARWYGRLLQLRDELTHGSVGGARLNVDTGAVEYRHPGVRVEGQPLVIEDIFQEFGQLIDGVNLFLGSVFVYLNDQLPRSASIVELCGMFNGSRAYARRITVQRRIDFGSGICLSRNWFDASPELMCPFANGCGAYHATPKENSEAD